MEDGYGCFVVEVMIITIVMPIILILIPMMRRWIVMVMMTVKGQVTNSISNNDGE